jgi:hypothetical protein
VVGSTQNWVQVALCFVYGFGSIFLHERLMKQSVVYSRRQGFRTSEKLVSIGFIVMGVAFVGAGVWMSVRMMAGEPAVLPPPGAGPTSHAPVTPQRWAHIRALVGPYLTVLGISLVVFGRPLAKLTGLMGRYFMSSWDGRLSARIGAALLAAFWVVTGLSMALRDVR